MISVLNLTRLGCRGPVLRVLQSRSHLLGGSQSPLVKKIDSRNTLKCLSPFSTSQSVLSADHSHSHTKLWTAERFLSAGLVGILPLSLAFPNPALDYALALALTTHVHWGIEAIVVDYARPRVVGETLARLAVASVYALSVFTLGGLFYFNYTDVGLCQAIRMLWKL